MKYIMCSVLVLVTVVLPLAWGSCPSGYVIHSEDKRCYKVTRALKTWTEARDACRSEGGDLVTIESADFNPLAGPDELKSEGKRYWMGLNDRNKEGTWRWNNGRDNVTYFNWGPGAPTTGDQGEAEDCGAIIRTGFNSFIWENADCTEENYYACGRDSDEDLAAEQAENGWRLNVSCPSTEWHRVPNRRLCIKLVTGEDYDWLSSMDACYDIKYYLPGRRGSSNLLHVNDFEINDFLKTEGIISSGQKVWISPTDYIDEGVYMNTVLRNAGKVNYLNWKPGTSRSEDNDCVYLEGGSGKSENTMVEDSCLVELPRLCQFIPPAPRRPVPPVKQCPEGWSKYGASDKCFKVMGERKTKWQPARDACKEMDSDLAIIPDQGTLDFIKGIVGTSRYWIGLKDKQKNGTFSWLGQDNEVEFTAWRNPPRNLGGDEYCVELIGNHEGLWNDKSCKAKKHFICQKDAKLP